MAPRKTGHDDQVTALRRTAVLLASSALVCGVCACGSAAGEGPGNGAGQATSTGPMSSAPRAAPTSTPGLPTPDAAQTAEIVAAFRAVEFALAPSQQSAVQGAVALCGKLQGGEDLAAAVPEVFPDVELDAAGVQAVGAAVTGSFCPLPGASASG